MEDTRPGTRFIEMDFDDFCVNSRNKDAVAWVTTQLDNLSEQKPRSVFLHGEPGTGKTWLMAELWKGVRSWSSDNGYNPPKMLWFQVTDLITRIREEMNTNSVKDIRKLCKSCDILFLDDLGTEHTTDWVLDSLISIIDHRYREKNTTCITTNISIEGLSSKYGDAMVSRIAEMCEVFRLEGEDFRIKEES